MYIYQIHEDLELSFLKKNKQKKQKNMKAEEKEGKSNFIPSGVYLQS